jgi:hypothetical protein
MTYTRKRMRVPVRVHWHAHANPNTTFYAGRPEASPGSGGCSKIEVCVLS